MSEFGAYYVVLDPPYRSEVYDDVSFSKNGVTVLMEKGWVLFPWHSIRSVEYRKT